MLLLLFSSSVPNMFSCISYFSFLPFILYPPVHLFVFFCSSLTFRFLSYSMSLYFTSSLFLYSFYLFSSVCSCDLPLFPFLSFFPLLSSLSPLIHLSLNSFSSFSYCTKQSIRRNEGPKMAEGSINDGRYKDVGKCKDISEPRWQLK